MDRYFVSIALVFIFFLVSSVCIEQAFAGSIGGVVWHDLDADGVRDAGEPGISGVTLDLNRWENGVFGAYIHIGTTTTDANGVYVYTGLVAGEYHIEVIDGVLPNLTSTTCICQKIVVWLSLDQDYNDANFGYGQPNGSISVIIWNDLNENGIRDAGEPGLPDMEVRLYGTCSQTVTTDSTGSYSFTGLAACNYELFADEYNQGFISDIFHFRI